MWKVYPRKVNLEEEESISLVKSRGNSNQKSGYVQSSPQFAFRNSVKAGIDQMVSKSGPRPSIRHFRRN
jgi:hypothetical protein